MKKGFFGKLVISLVTTLVKTILRFDGRGKKWCAFFSCGACPCGVETFSNFSLRFCVYFCQDERLSGLPIPLLFTSIDFQIAQESSFSGWP